MPDTELRCPTERRHLVAYITPDFDGDVRLYCHQCKVMFRDAVEGPRLDCLCGRWLHSGVIRTGWLQAACDRCGVLRFGPAGPAMLEPKPPKPKRPAPSRPKPLDLLVSLVEQRWAATNTARAWRRVDVAVGIRFAVFHRDHFRCRYCGRGPDDGVLLEVDHVTPRSRGGTDDPWNLVTACAECNLGKSDRLLDDVAVASVALRRSEGPVHSA